MTIKLLPLGDSITLGSSTNGGYRLPLQQMLDGDGIAYDFIGPETFNSVGMSDPEHAGYEFYKINDLLPVVSAVVGVPDLILLAIGTNDLYNSTDIPNINNRLDALIALCKTQWPQSYIICATAGPYGLGGGFPDANINAMNSDRVAYNSHIMGLTSAKGMAMEIPTSLLYDGVHPTAVGYVEMAVRWRMSIIGNYLGGSAFRLV